MFLFLLPLCFVLLQSIHADRTAYLAFKIVSPKITNRVISLHESAKTTHHSRSGIYVPNREEISSFFVDSNSFEMRLIDFNYDENEHEELIDGLLSNLTQIFCPTFPRKIPFDNFETFTTTNGAVGIQGRFQTNDPQFYNDLFRVLNLNGFIVLPSDRIQSDSIGFVVIKPNSLLRNLNHYTKAVTPTESAKELIQKPLLASAYVNKLHMCVEGADHKCVSLKSVKIERC
ncbi:hypothetical protein PFISCL1PPCAC_15842 [Pristionchus fissidentatus]|uniref:Uncharacterized protein n=1 Tax=Pristionchus fissidentatus TaxID=1538716 RepID=A0AAV5VYB2_9BILA|nr:hypothetical protein PFISCL1PPCAC_15842 [Pristionchus fissidentatus]